MGTLNSVPQSVQIASPARTTVPQLPQNDWPELKGGSGSGIDALMLSTVSVGRLGLYSTQPFEGRPGATATVPEIKLRPEG